MQPLSKAQIALFVSLSIADLTTTYFILKTGGSELNPVFSAYPELLIPAKVAAIALIVGLTYFLEKKIGQWGSVAPTGANVLTGWVVLHNLSILGAV